MEGNGTSRQTKNAYPQSAEKRADRFAAGQKICPRQAAADRFLFYLI